MGQGDFIEGYVVAQAQYVAGVDRNRDTQRAGDRNRFILGPGVVQLQLQSAFSGSNTLNAMELIGTGEVTVVHNGFDKVIRCP